MKLISLLIIILFLSSPIYSLSEDKIEVIESSDYIEIHGTIDEATSVFRDDVCLYSIHLVYFIDTIELEVYRGLQFEQHDWKSDFNHLRYYNELILENEEKLPSDANMSYQGSNIHYLNVEILFKLPKEFVKQNKEGFSVTLNGENVDDLTFIFSEDQILSMEEIVNAYLLTTQYQ